MRFLTPKGKFLKSLYKISIEKRWQEPDQPDIEQAQYNQQERLVPTG